MYSDNVTWDKYEGYTAGGGQNTVTVFGKKVKTSAILEMTKENLDVLFKV